MKIQAISNQTYTSKKFRVPVTMIDRASWDTHYTNPIEVEGYVKEYSNPQAKEIFEKLKKCKNINERANLSEQMGDYEIKPMNWRDMNWREKLLSILQIS